MDTPGKSTMSQEFRNRQLQVCLWLLFFLIWGKIKRYFIISIIYLGSVVANLEDQSSDMVDTIQGPIGISEVQFHLQDRQRFQLFRATLCMQYLTTLVTLTVLLNLNFVEILILN